MSTRYIWSVYDLELDYFWNPEWIWISPLTITTNNGDGEYHLVNMSSLPTNLGDGRGRYTGNYFISGEFSSTWADWPYFLVTANDHGNNTQVSNGEGSGTINFTIDGRYCRLFGEYNEGGEQKLEAPLVGSGILNLAFRVDGDKEGGAFREYTQGAEYVPGDFLEYVSSSSSSAYTEGQVGQRYYYRQSSDNPNPTNINISPSTGLEGGDTVTIQLTAPSSRYGTISYQYEVDTGNGYMPIATSTQKTYSYTIPEGSPYIRVRVKSQDNLGYVSTDYKESSQYSVSNNDPPTAPGSVTASNVVANNVATISITAATDPDGEVTNYEWSRSVDGSAYSVLQTTDADTLSITDEIGTDWGTVTYRVHAKDDYGEWGPYAISDTYTINEGLLTIAAPNYSLGMLTSPFYYTFSIGITGQPISTDGIDAIVYLDNRQIYEASNLEKDESVSVPIDPRLLSAITHSILIRANKEGYTTAEQTSDFYIEGISAPAGGIIEQLQNSAGQAVLPYTLGQCVIGRDGKDFNTIIEEVEAAQAKVYSGTYTGTGTYTAANPNSIIVNGTPKMAFIAEVGSNTGLIWGGSPSVGDVSVQSANGDLSWYSTSAASQYNEVGVEYYYMILT